MNGTPVSTPDTCLCFAIDEPLDGPGKKKKCCKKYKKNKRCKKCPGRI